MDLQSRRRVRWLDPHPNPLPSRERECNRGFRVNDREPDIKWPIVERLRAANHVVVLSGAGTSAESGIPTFRDAMTGLWAKFDPMQLATPEAFAADPELVTRWYDWRREKCWSCQPNAGHVALVEMEKHVLARGGKFTLVTQNVDRLHQRAGSQRVLELHGTLFEWRCVSCSKSQDVGGEPFASYPPLCDCGGARRPGVVWFGESLPMVQLSQGRNEAGSCDLFFTVGTSAVVYPAAGLIDAAIAGKPMTVEVNPDATPASSRVDHALRASASVLQRLVDAAFGEPSDA
ncbi:MAG: NAD-dependent protein deacylase [Phycisphaera sp.]|nr:NAD-dependent protein deacylase [Phycisphaera sp.]